MDFNKLKEAGYQREQFYDDEGKAFPIAIGQKGEEPKDYAFKVSSFTRSTYWRQEHSLWCINADFKLTSAPIGEDWDEVWGNVLDLFYQNDFTDAELKNLKDDGPEDKLCVEDVDRAIDLLKGKKVAGDYLVSDGEVKKEEKKERRQFYTEGGVALPIGYKMRAHKDLGCNTYMTIGFDGKMLELKSAMGLLEIPLENVLKGGDDEGMYLYRQNYPVNALYGLVDTGSNPIDTEPDEEVEECTDPMDNVEEDATVSQKEALQKLLFPKVKEDNVAERVSGLFEDMMSAGKGKEARGKLREEAEKVEEEDKEEITVSIDDEFLYINNNTKIPLKCSIEERAERFKAAAGPKLEYTGDHIYKEPSITETLSEIKDTLSETKDTMDRILKKLG